MRRSEVDKAIAREVCRMIHIIFIEINRKFMGRGSTKKAPTEWQKNTSMAHGVDVLSSEVQRCQTTPCPPNKGEE